jgi:hypothetical protein
MGIEFARSNQEAIPVGRLQRLCRETLIEFDRSTRDAAAR